MGAVTIITQQQQQQQLQTEGDVSGRRFKETKVTKQK